jgi:hypothetical protein
LHRTKDEVRPAETDARDEQGKNEVTEIKTQASGKNRCLMTSIYISSELAA